MREEDGNGVVVDQGLRSKPVVDHEAADLRDNAAGAEVDATPPEPPEPWGILDGTADKPAWSREEVDQHGRACFEAGRAAGAPGVKGDGDA